MKRISSYLIAVMLVSTVMISCNSGPGKKLKEAKEKVQTTSRAVKGMSKMEKESDDIGKRVEANKRNEANFIRVYFNNGQSRANVIRRRN